MTQYNPRYDTKIQPFNIGIIRKWVRDKDLKELKQWLDEGEPHKRLMKEAISEATISEWPDGVKALFEKDWINLEAKIKQVVGWVHFCKKDDVWIFARDYVFADKKLIKKFSFKLFWEAKEKGKESLFDESKVDFTDDEASSLLTYRYMFPDKHVSEEGKAEYKTKRDYLLSKPVLFIPYQLIDLLDFEHASYVVEMLEKHGKNPIFKTKEELFVFACAVGVYYQAAINHANKCNKSDTEKDSLKKEQAFMLKFLKEQDCMMEMDLTPKFLEKNTWINYNLEENYGDLCAMNQYRLTFGALKLKYFRTDYNKENQKLPESQKVKLAWYWIGGMNPEKRDFQGEKYVMTDDDKKYAEKEFEKLLKV